VIPDAVFQPLTGRDVREVAGLHPLVESSSVIQTGLETTALCTAMSSYCYASKAS